MPDRQEINIINFLKNPKVQLALFTLLSVIMAIGFFGDPNISGTQTVASTPTAPSAPAAAAAAPAAAADASSAATAASTTSVAATQVAVASSKFFIATLSPMAAGFTLIPFIISILGIGISLRGIKKQNKEKKIQKVINRYEAIDKEQVDLSAKYEEQYRKLLALSNVSGANLLDPSNKIDDNLDLDVYHVYLFSLNDNKKKFTIISISNNKIKINDIPNKDFLKKLCIYHINYTDNIKTNQNNINIEDELIKKCKESNR
jgi:hypothetical protein